MDNLEKLKEIGADKIAKDTHLSKDIIIAILNKNYDNPNIVKTIGFIKILEHEYQVDLSQWISDYKLHHANESRQTKIFYSTCIEKQSNFSVYMFFIVISIMIIAVGYLVYEFNLKNKISFETSTTKEILTAKDNLEVIKAINENYSSNSNIAVDENQTQSVDSFLEKNQSEETTYEAIHSSSVSELNKSESSLANGMMFEKITIKPKMNSWCGLINLKTGQKGTITTKEPFDLSLKEPLLVLFGHGFLNIQIGDKIEEFSDKNTLRLYLHDGRYEIIGVERFKELNKGNEW
ncbi:MAG: hypothetical protein HXX81_06370 [Campylobacterales bacterium]|nr:hypothetical protein [Campylobacterales bacterium]